MRHILLVISFLLLLVTGYAQEDRTAVLMASYFKVMPGQKTFPVFLQTLTKDPAFTTDTVINRTDTSLFYLRGYYTAFSPFSFPAKQIEVQLREISLLNEKKVPVDTLLVYQLIGYSDSTWRGREKVVAAFKKMSGDFRAVLNHVVYKRNPTGMGESNFFYRTRNSISLQGGTSGAIDIPESFCDTHITWGKSYKNNDYVLSLVYYLRVEH